MNRRQFFGMSAAAVAIAGLPSIVLPERTIFLPPRAGWFRSPLPIREVEQYVITTDSMLLRYDAAWIKNGERLQYYVDTQLPADSEREHVRAVARSMLERMMDENGLARAQRVELQIPRYAKAGYV